MPRYDKNLSTAKSATIKDMTNPMPRACHSTGVMLEMPLWREKTVAPNMVGIARKKENSAAALAERPAARPPMMVEADRDMPGKRERH